MKYFVLEGRHLVSFEDIPAELMQAHFDFLQAGYDAGHFLFSGPTVPPNGSYLVARAPSREALGELLAAEPYTTNGVMVFATITEFFPRQHAPAIDDWFGKTAPAPSPIQMVRHDDFDVYRPRDAAAALPAVIIVHGPAPAGMRLRESPFFAGYGRWLAGHGIAAVIVDVRYQGLQDWTPATVWPPNADWTGTARWLETVVERVRGAADIDGDRVAIWAFSGGGMLTASWLARSPAWLRCVTLVYPVLADPAPRSTAEPAAPADVLEPGRPVVLVRVGRERPEFQATVDRFLARATKVDAAIQIVDVPDGTHGFDAALASLADSPPIAAATAATLTHLTEN